MLIDMLKKETRRKKIDPRISISLSPLYYFLSYLVIGNETGVRSSIKGGKKKNPQSIKEQPQQSLSACLYLLSAGSLTSEGFAWELPIFRQDQGSPCHLQAGCTQLCFYTCILKDLFLYLLMWIWVCLSMGRGGHYPRIPETLDPLKPKFQAVVVCGYGC